ncbi:hypothetical protein GALL_409940 [mine drainage metagenome]|uniref:Uncharacterized protein n=1 Tax=mine drainage metagenome TaxID=410659 RepID=A0A1J5QMT4_9ZZZZ
MGDQDRGGRIAAELDEESERRIYVRCLSHHLIGDAGECGDEGRDRITWVYKSSELAENLTGADLDCANFSYARPILRGTAGGLQIYDDKGRRVEGGAEIAKAELS